MNLSFVIPCYRSERTIENVIREIEDTMNLRSEKDYEIICINDHSPDKVYDVLKKIASMNKHVRIINFAKNFGKASAVLAGYASASGKFIVTLDDDGQCPADRTWDLVDALSDEVDMAVADYPHKKENMIKRIGSKVNNRVMNILIDHPKGITFNNFSVMKKFIADEIIKYENPFPALHPMVAQTTHDIVMVRMEERDRADDNVSGFTFWKSFRLMINGFTNFSVKPLRIATVMGFLFAIGGFIFGLYLVVKRMLHPEMVVGYASMMVVILLIGGIIMILLGIIGEYIGRIYISINNGPQYVIRNTINFEEKEYGFKR